MVLCDIVWYCKVWVGAHHILHFLLPKSLSFATLGLMRSNTTEAAFLKRFSTLLEGLVHHHCPCRDNQWGIWKKKNFFSDQISIVRTCCLGNPIGLLACCLKNFTDVCLYNKVTSETREAWLLCSLIMINLHILTNHHSDRINYHIPALQLLRRRFKRKQKSNLGCIKW